VTLRRPQRPDERKFRASGFADDSAYPRLEWNVSGIEFVDCGWMMLRGISGCISLKVVASDFKRT
jgi:hypothetical protein